MATPKATNSLSAYAVFHQRTVYKDDSYPKDIPEPIDLWYDKPLYGKINGLSNSLILSEAVLKQYKTKGARMIMGANFVVDAFEDFRKFFERSINQGKLDINDSVFEDLEPKIGWSGVNPLYHNQIQVMLDSFTNVFTKELNREEKIVDFRTFLDVFLEFVDILCPHYMMTRTGFVTTKHCSPEITGLAVQIRKQNHALDEIKFNKFIQDKNYDFYVTAARSFGFSIDKNAPWRLVADINSPAMQKYIEKYGIMPAKVLSQYYYEAFRLEMASLKVYISQFYNSYISVEPLVNVIKVSKSGRVIREQFKRQPLNPKELTDDFWMRLYIYLRLAETSTDITQFRFDQLTSNANYIAKNVDIQKALEYINRRLDKKHLLSLVDKEVNIKELSLKGTRKQSGICF